MSKIHIEQGKERTALLLAGLLAALPTAAAAAVVQQGDSVLWATVERGLSAVSTEAYALGDASFSGQGTWTNDPNFTLSVTDCDCDCTSTTTMTTTTGGDDSSGGDSSGSDDSSW